ncbi:MAG: VPLPA-CTERM sorting domain-containing protein [Paracoccaceae bacterium]
METVLRDVSIVNPVYEAAAQECREQYSGSYGQLGCYGRITAPLFATVKRPFVIDSGVVEGSQRSTKKWDEDTGWIGLDLGVTSAAGKLKTSGEVGLALDYTLNTGTVTPELSYSAQAHLPNAKSVEAGEFFSLGSSSGVDAGTIQATSPTAKLSVDAIFEIASSVSGRACIGVSPLATCSSRTLTLPGSNKPLELFSIDLNNAKIIDGFLPPNVHMQLPVGNLKAQLVNVNGAVYVTTNTGYAYPGPPPPSGLAIELGSVELTQPVISSTGTLLNGSLTTSGRTDFIDLTADIDGLLMLPGASGAFKVKLPGILPDIKGSIDIYDMDLTLSLDLAQEYKLNSTLMVDLAFDRLVNVAGFGEVLSWSGAWDSMPDMAVSGLTTFTPTYWLDASMQTALDFILGFGYQVDLLKGKFKVAGLGGSFGPVASAGDVLASTSFNLMDRSFAVTGFNSFAGPSFMVDPLVREPVPIGPTPVVPLPASIFLLVGSLAGLGGIARRRKLATPPVGPPQHGVDR